MNVRRNQMKITKEGEGLFTYKNGQTFKGIFKGDGVWNGEGYVYFSDKSYYKGNLFKRLRVSVVKFKTYNYTYHFN